MTTSTPLYLDPAMSAADRAADLMSRMTVAEKIAQLGSIWGFEVIDEHGVNIDRLRELAGDGLGSLTRIAGSTNLHPREVVTAANAIQRFLVEQTRLGIPALMHEECLHGLMALDAPSFQQSIGAAATFDPELVERVAATIRRRMLATGARHALGPVLDITRDPRWGRVEETYGEDPYLAAAMGAAYVRGLQGDDLRTGVMATAKHMVGHGLAEGGLNQAPVHVGWRELHDEQLLPFETAVVDAAIATVMPAYCDVDGLACHASSELLTSILRDRWGFRGVVVSDYAGIEMLSTAHRMSDDMAEIARMALEAGVDMELPRRSAYDQALQSALDSGLVEEAAIDRALARILEMKFRIGLFEEPYVPDLTSETLAQMVDEESQAAADLARRSMVLLHNDGILPLAPTARRIALIGPGAASPREMVGDYSHLVHVETLIETRRSGSTAFGVVASGGPLSLEDELAGRTTLLEALRNQWPAADIRYAMGVGLHEGSDAGIAEAVEVAEEADVAIVVAIERSGLTEDATTGEFRDRRDIGLFGRQQELLDAVVATGTPVVLVVISGRPLALERAARDCSAILLAWVPGEAGPRAIAEILTGASDPGGRLPIGMPRHVGQLPLTYRHHPTGGRSNPRGDYVDGPAGPLWPFGHGLSYTRFDLADMRLDRTDVATLDGSVTISINVSNVGERAGDEIVQLYVRDEAATVARPVLELLGFLHVALLPGETRTVEFVVRSEQFAHTAADYRRVVEPGRVSLFVGRSSVDLPCWTAIELTGDTVEVRQRKHFLTESRLR